MASDPRVRPRARDKIDLATVDANNKVGGNQAFRSAGTGNVDQPGQIGTIGNSRGERCLVAETTGSQGYDIAIQLIDFAMPIGSRDLIL
jgi:hypothetical protein